MNNLAAQAWQILKDHLFFQIYQSLHLVYKSEELRNKAEITEKKPVRERAAERHKGQEEFDIML